MIFVPTFSTPHIWIFYNLHFFQAIIVSQALPFVEKGKQAEEIMAKKERKIINDIINIETERPCGPPRWRSTSGFSSLGWAPRGPPRHRRDTVGAVYCVPPFSIPSLIVFCPKIQIWTRVRELYLEFPPTLERVAKVFSKNEMSAFCTILSLFFLFLMERFEESHTTFSVKYVFVLESFTDWFIFLLLPFMIQLNWKKLFESGKISSGLKATVEF